MLDLFEVLEELLQPQVYIKLVVVVHHVSRDKRRRALPSSRVRPECLDVAGRRPSELDAPLREDLFTVAGTGVPVVQEGAAGVEAALVTRKELAAVQTHPQRMCRCTSDAPCMG